jgi:hypothetical protein
MTRRLAIAVALAILSSVVATAAFEASLEKALDSSQYVYIASTRKDGTLSKPAEIWFLWHRGAVYVATPKTAWRVRRIEAGRPQAKIWVGKPDGPSFVATGALVKSPEINAVMFETFAKKYADHWKSYEERFRTGLKDGSRVLVRYTPN